MKTILFLAVLLAACGRTVTAPVIPPPPPVTPPPPPVTPPPPPPGIARVELVTNKGVVFTGGALPGERLVARVIDSAGNVVTNATLTANASAGWTVRGDTIIAPASEGFGQITITASESDPSSATSDPATLASTIDLSKFQITAAGVTCRVDTAKYLNEVGGNVNRYQGPVVPGKPYGYFIDSAVVSGVVVDSLHYAGSGDWRLTSGWDLAGAVYWHAASITYYTWYPAGASFPQTDFTGFVKVYRQVPDTLVLGDQVTPFPAAQKGPLAAPSYTVNGLPFCENVLGRIEYQLAPTDVKLDAR